MRFAKGVDRAVAQRVGGYALYCSWMLATFYNTFLFDAATDFRATLYLNTLVSLGVLSATLALVPLLVRKADKWVLSKRFTLSASIVMALSTVLLYFANAGTGSGLVATLLSAVLTGLSSGLLFLGWCRVYADVGPRPTIIEMGVAWTGAALVDIALSLLPNALSFGLVVVVALVSGVLLRSSAFSRPERPVPAHEHRLHRRTRRIFLRGLAACALIGLTCGFSDVLAGFRYVRVPDRYEIFLAVSLVVACAIFVIVAKLGHQEYMRNARRLVVLAIAVGCLLTLFSRQAPALGNIVLFGAYQGAFGIMLAAVCIDVSNYFDQPATRTFGFAFFALYMGEFVGNCLGHGLVLGLGTAVLDLDAIVTIMTLTILVASLFLFTESDLIETSVGEMVDEETSDEALEVSLTQGVFARVSTKAEDGGVGAQASDVAGSSGSDAAPDRTAASAEGSLTIEQVADRLSERFDLTAREAQVLPLVLRGRTIARIQDELHISQGTVSTHIRHIYQKAQVHNRQDLLDLLEKERQG